MPSAITHHRCSELVAEWNETHGLTLDADVAYGCMLSLEAALMDEPEIRRCAKDKDREALTMFVEDRIIDAIYKCLEQTEIWYQTLLHDKQAQRDVATLCSYDIYWNR